MTKSIQKPETTRVLLSAIVGAVAGLVIGIGLSAIGALFIANEYFEMDSMNILTYIIQLISSFTGTLLAANRSKGKELLAGGMASGCYFAILLLTAMLFCEGVGDGAYLSLVAILVGGVSAIMLCIRRTNGNSKRKRRRHSR